VLCAVKIIHVNVKIIHAYNRRMAVGVEGEASVGKVRQMLANAPSTDAAALRDAIEQLDAVVVGSVTNVSPVHMPSVC
jgi:hypothetical protein